MEPGQTLYELWTDMLYDEGVSTDDWKDIEETDRRAWAKLTETLKEEGWKER